MKHNELRSVATEIEYGDYDAQRTKALDAGGGLRPKPIRHA